MRVFWAIFILIILAVGAFFIYIYSGYYNVAASKPHTAFVKWVFGTTMNNSVGHHATPVELPARSDSAAYRTGFMHYREMCQTCHGGPGVSPSEIGDGLNPKPPDLTKAAQDWSDGELYWIVKNGVKMTGMPGFGKTHNEEQLANMVLFVKYLPGMTAEQYKTLEQQVEAQEHEHEEAEAEQHTH